jgi:hypothetical protein
VSTTRRFDFVHRIIDARPPEDPHIKAVGDIDGDGFSDVVVASSKGGPLVWYRNPRWEKYVVSPAGAWSCSAQIVDMDGDGDCDILISEWYTQSRLEWYENPLPDGDPARGPWRRHLLGSPRAHDICTGDVDGDGQMEIVTRSQGEEGGEIIIWKRAGGKAWSRGSLACPIGEGLALGDLSGRGRLDIVIGGRWYEAPEDALAGHWQEHVFADWPADATVRAADINGDGRMDVVLARSEGEHRLSWFETPPDPRSSGWPEHVVDSSVSAAHSLVVCDIDGDGQLDLITAEMHQSPTKRVMAYLAEPGGKAWTRAVISETGSHNLNVIRLADTGRLALVGANWSGEYQPLELWELHATRR